jgi:hypothetical protein
MEPAYFEADMMNKSDFAEKRAKMIKRRTGLTRSNNTLVIGGLRVARIIGAPLTIRERQYHVARVNFARGGKKGRTIHFALLRYTFQTADGRTCTALQAQAHDANHGYMLNVTGFWNVIPA